MKKVFSIPAAVAVVLERLEAAGYEAYLVGGCVRDWYRGVCPHDYDITTAAEPQEVLRVFADERVLETGLRHGTVTILIDGEAMEVTTFRLDGDYQDHRRPESVTFTRSLREDLARRDFTMNAMAMDRQGGIIDPFGGRADIDQGRIRAVGEADRRFEEDALRILRGLRFAARLGFEIEAQTAAAMHRKKALLHAIARERVLAELSGLLLSDHCEQVLQAQLAILQVILPAVQKIGPLQAVPPRESLRWAALLAPANGAALAKLKPSAALRQRVELLLREAPEVCPLERIAVKKRCAALGIDCFEELLSLQKALAPQAADYEGLAQLAAALRAENACLSLAQLAIGGRDLMALGLEGPAIGEQLQQLLEQVVEERLPNTREALLHALKK